MVRLVETEGKGGVCEACGQWQPNTIYNKEHYWDHEGNDPVFFCQDRASMYLPEYIINLHFFSAPLCVVNISYSIF